MKGYKFYTVFSKHPSSKEWTIERTYGSRDYANQVAKAIRNSGRLAKIKIK